MFDIYIIVYTWVINSVVECLPYKQKVTGSNPVLPIKNTEILFYLFSIRKNINLGPIV